MRSIGRILSHVRELTPYYVGIVACAVLVALTGHSGAQATWTSRLATPNATPGQAAPTASTITMEEVARHNSADSCWAVVEGGVYDLTQWIDLHPGGRQRILDLCGTDTTGKFELQHSRNPRSNAQLERLKIGELG